MVQYLHFRILEFPLILGFRGFDTAWSILLAVQPEKKTEKKRSSFAGCFGDVPFFLKKTKDETTYPRLGMMGMDFKW
jgi:hypothetical protein